MSGAQTVALSLGGHRDGNSWIARCPAHDDRVPSLSIRDADDGGVFVHCAGCDQAAVIEALRLRGLWRGRGSRRPPDRQRQHRAVAPNRLESADYARAALRLWRASEPSAGTLVEAYLRSRGLTLAPPKLCASMPV
jgi:putative DNA primase/helicase